jgi:DsbC/DsbD-like thiol-disulfide interchange protein/cytochrome c biogenesis protein CcdA
MMLTRKLFRLGIMRWLKVLALLVGILPTLAHAAPVKTEHVEAELLAESAAATPGRTLTVALRLKMIPHWHTYWRNPGDSGQPTTIEWQLPQGWTAGPIQWPAPARLPIRHLLNFGYENEVLLLTDIAVPANAAGAAKIAARATWLVCNEDHCIPEEGDLALALPVGPAAATPDAPAIARTRAALPVPAAGLSFAAARGAEGVELKIAPPLKSAVFFPFEEGKIENAGAQAYEGGVLRIPRAKQPVGAFTRVSGLLVADGKPLEIDVPVALAPSASGVASLALAVAFAFFGGLILNLMPCVLPVLSIKILGFAGQADRGAMRAHGLLYGAGVVLSFLLFAGVLAALQAAGSELGWGFQLQSPVFVGLLALLFLALALNLCGVFELSFLVPSGIAGLSARNKKLDAFLTGVLAVVVASPCTAPFMGAALGFALAGGPVEAVAVFAALGIGMALPYVALAWHPAWLRWLPKPGPWMNTFKRVLAIPLFATVLWLGWVLALQSGVLAASSDWEKFTAQTLAAHEKQGRSVFVDYTAAWCVTCQVNKQLVLQQPDVEKALRDSGLALVRADWTRRDPDITRALAALGRKGVPVYAIYRPGAEPVLLPEILTRDTVLAALKTTQENRK